VTDTPAEIYLDANASAPLRPEAREAVLAALDLGPGNASSPHAAGRRLRRTLSEAREAVAALVGARPRDVVFTSGATEANALAIHGALAARAGALVTTRAEHPSVARAAERAAAGGREVRVAGVDRWGRFDAADVARLAADGAALVSTVLAQSVTGVLEPVEEVARRIPEIALHVDAVQAAGRIDVDLGRLGASFVSLSAHKIGGPQGIGALVLREGAAWTHPLGGGAQELGRRPGTEAVALAAGFGAAARAARSRRRDEEEAAVATLVPLRRLLGEVPGLSCLSPPDGVLANTVLFAADDCPGDALMAALDGLGFRVSTGSACASGARLPPEVLVAGGWSAADASRAVRVSVSWATRADEILALVGALPGVVARVRAAAATS
jgi:cysteine desulfurase